MQPQGKSVRRVLVITLVGILVVFLTVLFVKVFFISRSSMSSTTMMSASVPSLGVAYGNPMGSYRDNGTTVQTMPSAEMMDGDGAERRVVSTASSPVMVGEKMIKTGTLSLRVKSTDGATQEVYALATQMGGTVSNSSFSQYESNLKSGTLTVRVPVGQFDEMFVALKKIAVVVQTENTAGTDVTMQAIDLQARINNKKAAETTMQTLFDRAVKISDVIEVTDKLTVLRGEIESLEGQMRYLNDQTAMSTITLSMSEDTIIQADRGFRPLQTIKESVVVLLKSLGQVAERLIAFAIIGLPSLVVYGFVLWIIYRFVRRMVAKCWIGNTRMEQKITRKK